MNEAEASELALRRAEMLVQMSNTIQALAAETRALRQEVSAVGHRRRNEMVLLGGGIVLLLFVSFLALRISLVQRDNHKVLDTVRSATTPTGKIYKANQDSTAEAIRRIVQTAIDADQCIRDAAPDIQACVNSKQKGVGP